MRRQNAEVQRDGAVTQSTMSWHAGTARKVNVILIFITKSKANKRGETLVQIYRAFGTGNTVIVWDLYLDLRKNVLA